MSERATPETDDLDRELHNPRVLQDRYSEMMEHAQNMERERDEARESIIGWENKWKCAVEMAAQAEVERDEARNLFESSKRARASLNEALDKTLHELREAREQLAAAKHFLEKYIAERDEAWACCDELVVDSNAITLAKTVMRLERERDEAREENEKLREALLRIRTWGIESKNFSSNDNSKMAHWIDEGCIGNLPKPDGPWIYEKMEATK